MNLKNLLAPSTALDHEELRRLCLRNITSPAFWEITSDGLVNVSGSFDAKSFTDHGKLMVSFGDVITVMFKPGNVVSLKGFPKTLTGVIDIRSQWLRSLEGCTKQVTGSIYIDSDMLQSLEHGPESADFYAITSTELTSLHGISKTGIKVLKLGKCSNVKTTDGLSGAVFESLMLPNDLKQVTDYPDRCPEIFSPACAGFYRLFLIEDLKVLKLTGPYRSDGNYSSLTKVQNICDEVLKTSGNKRRYLKAQTLLIDQDFEELI